MNDGGVRSGARWREEVIKDIEREGDGFGNMRGGRRHYTGTEVMRIRGQQREGEERE